MKHFLHHAGQKLINNVQIANGSNIKIDIRSLTSSPTTNINCVLAPGGKWKEEVKICFTKPPNSCNKNTQNPRYMNRVTFKDTATLEIKDVRPDESGIYKCERKPQTEIKILISGVIIVGRLFLIICPFSRSVIKQIMIGFEGNRLSICSKRFRIAS